MHLHGGCVSISESSLPHADAVRVRPAFPEDLRVCIGESELASMSMEWANDIGNGNASKKCLLGLITYSYLSGTYNSEEIEGSLYENPNPWRFTDQAYAAGDIREYRRHHRASIERCMVEVLRRACGPGDFSEEDSAGEAAQRVNRAIREDHWALDF